MKLPVSILSKVFSAKLEVETRFRSHDENNFHWNFRGETNRNVCARKILTNLFRPSVKTKRFLEITIISKGKSNS